MYVCICNGVTESDIDEAVRDGARSLDCLTERLGVASCCGQCEEYAIARLDASATGERSAAPVALGPVVVRAAGARLRLAG